MITALIIQIAMAFMGILVIIATIRFAICWVRLRNETAPYNIAGLAAAVSVLCFNIFTLVIMPGEVSLAFAIPLTLFACIQFSAFTVMGSYYTRELDKPLFFSHGTNFHIDPKSEIKKWIIGVMSVIAGAMVLTIVVFRLFQPHQSELLSRLSLGGSRISFVTAALFATMALGEEIVFRLGLQNYMAYRHKWTGGKYWYAILFSTVLWSIGHLAILDPPWVKMLQIFPFGLALGWLCGRFGLLSCMVAHAGFNILIMFPSTSLL